MSRCFAVAYAMLICFISSSEAYAMGGDHAPGKLAKTYRPDWPAGLVDLINSGDRVEGHWVNQSDFFYYRGDTAALKLFLSTYGKLSNTPLAVILHVGSKPMTGSLGGEQKTPYQWQLEIIRRGWGVALDPRLPPNEPGYVASIHIWLNDEITLENLEIPKHLAVRSANDIERFIQKHSSQVR